MSRNYPAACPPCNESFASVLLGRCRILPRRRDLAYKPIAFTVCSCRLRNGLLATNLKPGARSRLNPGRDRGGNQDQHDANDLECTESA